MTAVFYCIFIIFIWNEIYYIKNKLRIDKIKSLKKTSKIDIIFYTTRIIYWIFIIIGLFSSLKIIFLTLLIAKIIQVPLYHINRKVFIYYDNFLPLISSIIILIILITKIIN